MVQLLFRIYCLTTVTLLHASNAISSKQKLNSLNAKRENVEKDLRQHLPKKSLMVFVDANSQDDSLNEDNKGENLEIGNDMLRMQSSTVYRNRRSTTTPAPRTRPRDNNENAIKKKKEEAEREHQRKVNEVIKHVSVYYQSNIYFAYEARRIVQTGIVIDELRQIGEDVEKLKHGRRLRIKAVECGKPVPEPPKFVWPKPRGAVIHVVKDALNDGV